MKKGAILLIKGINRQMLEISDTKSPYFERAFLVIRTQLDAVGEDTLRHAASELLASTDSCSHLQRCRRRLWGMRILWVLVSAASGAALTLLLQWILNM